MDTLAILLLVAWRMQFKRRLLAVAHQNQSTQVSISSFAVLVTGFPPAPATAVEQGLLRCVRPALLVLCHEPGLLYNFAMALSPM